MAKKSTGLPPYKTTAQTRSGGNSMTSDVNVSRAAIGSLGVNGARHIIVKPTDTFGDIGTSQPLKSFAGYKDLKGTTLGRPVVRTKPSR